MQNHETSTTHTPRPLVVTLIDFEDGMALLPPVSQEFLLDVRHMNNCICIWKKQVHGLVAIIVRYDRPKHAAKIQVQTTDRPTLNLESRQELLLHAVVLETS